MASLACITALAVQALKAAGREWEVVFTGSSMTSLNGAVEAGLGVLAIIAPARRSKPASPSGKTRRCRNCPISIAASYVREGGARAAYEQLADDIAAVLQRRHGRRAPRSISPHDAARARITAA